jgi:hypothetical protein
MRGGGVLTTAQVKNSLNREVIIWMLYLGRQLCNYVLKSVRRIVVSGIDLLTYNAGAATTFAKGNPDKMCLSSQEGYRGCNLINKRYAQRPKVKVGQAN